MAHWESGVRCGDDMYREARAEDYARLLGEGGLPADREISLRTYTWWLDNKPRRRQRESSLAFTPLSEAALENLHALDRLLAEQPDDASKLSRADLLRQLGRFDQVLPLLDALPPDHKPERQQKIRELTAAQDPWVGFVEWCLFVESRLPTPCRPPREHAARC